jgi:hypothetical protein
MLSLNLNRKSNATSKKLCISTIAKNTSSRRLSCIEPRNPLNILKLYARFKFKFKYFKLKTREGGGVMHIVFRKAYNVPKIPFEWLSTQWNQIWGSPRVNISEIKFRNSHKLSMYLVGQYFAKQPVIRMSYGHHWVFTGFAKSFKHIIEVYGFKRAIEIWNKRMRNNDLPLTGRQTRLRQRKMPEKTMGVIGLNNPKTKQSTLVSVRFWAIFGGYFVCQS